MFPQPNNDLKKRKLENEEFEGEIVELTINDLLPVITSKFLQNN